MHASQLCIQHTQVAPAYLCNTLPIASMPPREYFCDCPIRCKQRKKVSKTTYFDHAKYRNLPAENYQDFLMARGVMLQPGQQHQQDDLIIEAHQDRRVPIGLMDMYDNGGEQDVQGFNQEEVEEAVRTILLTVDSTDFFFLPD